MAANGDPSEPVTRFRPYTPDYGIPSHSRGMLSWVHVQERMAEARNYRVATVNPDARSPARTRPDGGLVPLAEQDRNLWARGAIREGVALVTDALSQGPTGPNQLQAAIAAVHDEAQRAEDTDWPQILALYELLERISDNPVVTLNRAVAVAMVRGPRAGLDLLEALDAGELLTCGDGRRSRGRPMLLPDRGRRTISLPEQRYLEAHAARLADHEHNSAPPA